MNFFDNLMDFDNTITIMRIEFNLIIDEISKLDEPFNKDKQNSILCKYGWSLNDFTDSQINYLNSQIKEKIKY